MKVIATVCLLFRAPNFSRFRKILFFYVLICKDCPKMSKINPKIKVTGHASDDLEEESHEKTLKKQSRGVSGGVDAGTCRVYVQFKSTIAKTGIDPKTLHPKIDSVRLPRKGLNAKFCFLIFKSKKIAAVAIEKIRARGDCFVKESVSPTIKSKADLTEKLAAKANMRNLWA